MLLLSPFTPFWFVWENDPVEQLQNLVLTQGLLIVITIFLFIKYAPWKKIYSKILFPCLPFLLISFNTILTMLCDRKIPGGLWGQKKTPYWRNFQNWKNIFYYITTVNGYYQT